MDQSGIGIWQPQNDENLAELATPCFRLRVYGA